MSSSKTILDAFNFLGQDLNHNEGDTEAIGTCPWCLREDKFSLNTETGVWRCFVCAEGSEDGGGNIYTYIRKLWEVSQEATSDEALDELAKDRGFLGIEELKAWGVCRSALDQEWLVPGFNEDGKLTTLYKYVSFVGRTSGMNLMPTPSLGHKLHGVNLYEKNCEAVYLCEGWSDGIRLREALRQGKATDEGIRPTASKKASLLDGVSVLAIPGCQTFKPNWAPLFAGKRVLLLGDNDHPKEVEGKLRPPGALTGMERIINILSGSDHPPESCHYIAWGSETWENGGEFSKERKHGFDVRDLLNA